MASTVKEKPQGIELTTLSMPQLSAVKKQLDDELEHLTNSFAKLRAAQAKFRDCVKAIADGISPDTAGKIILLPLTTSLYVPGKIVDTEHVIVDIGTGFYAEKTTKDATDFYNIKVEELAGNLRDLETVVQGKSTSLRAVEDVLRQKVVESNRTSAAGQKNA
ncbi:MAG: subunit of tubulin prefoldin [Trizodia sp. TS-e1964]|nr:MAG: subunit of tubulin prefoldin [Trizodia sp. TS-e1964]